MIRSAILALRSTKAVSAAEYAILAVGIVIVVGGAAAALGPNLETAFQAIGTKITGATPD
ncbi:Flp family type IVb pilin [Roseomonas frigidaquae]|uniref:Flp family type IVb pilin n=1 Tax=Falsiroseomonas frigidaquae TaxID=487318 RepID=A0ABX1F1N2_9PROT|nr:Flp family type IVb pilin [Falsiroseomonas frigidaquae]NKE46207.1 Flp family type IVb pilin [Falsiroseomonas frigidaquae]